MCVTEKSFLISLLYLNHLLMARLTTLQQHNVQISELEWIMFQSSEEFGKSFYLLDTHTTLELLFTEEKWFKLSSEKLNNNKTKTLLSLLF